MHLSNTFVPLFIAGLVSLVSTQSIDPSTVDEATKGEAHSHITGGKYTEALLQSNGVTISKAHARFSVCKSRELRRRLNRTPAHP